MSSRLLIGGSEVCKMLQLSFAMNQLHDNKVWDLSSAETNVNESLALRAHLYFPIFQSFADYRLFLKQRFIRADGTEFAS
jgi:hypothetical protein